jgi:flavin-dependent dehydrogenase
MTYDFVIIGAGIIGLTVARKILIENTGPLKSDFDSYVRERKL